MHDIRVLAEIIPLRDPVDAIVRLLGADGGWMAVAAVAMLAAAIGVAVKWHSSRHDGGDMDV